MQLLPLAFHFSPIYSPSKAFPNPIQSCTHTRTHAHTHACTQTHTHTHTHTDTHTHSVTLIVSHCDRLGLNYSGWTSDIYQPKHNDHPLIRLVM